MSVKNSSDIIGNRTRNFPVYNSVPQPTEPPRAPITNLGHQADIHGTEYECRANEESPSITIFNILQSVKTKRWHADLADRSATSTKHTLFFRTYISNNMAACEKCLMFMFNDDKYWTTGNWHVNIYTEMEFKHPYKLNAKCCLQIYNCNYHNFPDLPWYSRHI